MISSIAFFRNFALPTALFWFVFVGLAAAQSSPTVETAKSGSSNSNSETVPLGKKRETIREFRRWFAPIDHIREWPLGPGPYWPTDRHQFEQWAETLEESSKRPNAGKTPTLSRIVLRAAIRSFQLLEGTGILVFPENPTMRSFPLEPWELWTSPPDDGNRPLIVHDSDGGLRLWFPPEEPDAATSDDRNRETGFNWSLRSRPDSRGCLQYDFSLPPCLSIELHLDLPPSLVPTCSTGLVTETSGGESGDVLPEGFRRWRILAGRNSRFSVSVAVEGGVRTVRGQTTIQRSIRYTIEPQGLNVSTTIKFEKSDARIEELILDVESPLRIVGIQYGTQPVAWTRLSASPEGDGMRFHVNLSEFARREVADLTLLAMAPLLDARPWTLPRIRIVSSDVFWMETRCGVHVIQPLQVRSIDARHAKQTRPRTVIDQSDREVFVFQFSEDDAIITVDFDGYKPEVAVEGAVQFLWGNNEVRGNMVLECGITEGDCYQLQFPVTPNWTIDSVKSLHWMVDSSRIPAGDEVLSWDVLEDRDGTVKPNDPVSATRILSIQLKSPIRSRKSLQIQLSGRFQPENRDEFRLSDFSPLAPLPETDATLAVAVQQTSSQFQLQYRTPMSFRPNPDNPAKLRQIQHFIEDATGSVFDLDTRGRELRFVLERLKPNYSSEITGVATLKDKELHFDFDIKCQPVDSSVDRVYVHFAPGSTNDTDFPVTESDPPGLVERRPWIWTGLSDAIKPLQARRLPPEELEDLFPTVGSRGLLDDFLHGETWEIRLPVPQSGPFVLRAASSVPLADSITVPLAALPFSTNQRGEIYIRTPRLFRYRVVNTRLKSIPIPPEKWFRYEETRAAFRYNPREEPRLSLQSPLSLKRLSPEEMPPSAWIWSQRLDTQYEPEGIVKNNAVFLIENRGKDKLRIRLPDGIGVGDVHAVWRDNQREIWHPEVESPADRFYTPLSGMPGREIPGPQTEKSIEEPGHVVVIALPEGVRFITVSLEYSSRDKPLVRQRKLVPRYPAADVPILSGGWTSWFPPEFDVSLPSQFMEKGRTFHFSEALNHVFSGRILDLFSENTWNRLFHGDRRRRETEAGAQIFFDWIGTRLPADEGSDLENDFLRENLFSQGGRLTEPWGEENKVRWTDLLSDEKRLLDRISQLGHDGSKGVDINVLIDRKALAFLGIYPDTTVPVSEISSQKRRGVELFEQSGLVLLVSTRIRSDRVREYNFRITSSLVLSLHRHFESESIGPCARSIPESVELATRDAGNSDNPFSSDLPELATPHWIPLSRWLAESQSLSLPWSISSQIIRLSSVTPDWNAFEMAPGPDNELYVVHRNTFAAYKWLAFLAVVVLTARKPFSHPVVLILLLILFEILSRIVAPCQAGVPGGAFLGALVSLGFCLVRSRNLRTAAMKWRSRQSANSLHTDSTHTHYTATEEDAGDSNAIGVPTLVLTIILASSLFSVTELYGEMPTNVPRSSPSFGTIPGDPNSVAPNGEAYIVTEIPSDNRPQTAPSEIPEAYRVFFPIDENRRIIGDYVYVPVELRALLWELWDVKAEPAHQWSITKSDYQGSIVFNPMTQKLELGDDFTAVFEILLESENALITLPPLPFLQGHTTWDSRPIQPTWRTQGTEQKRILVFQVENEQKGKHHLRLPLVPTIGRQETGTNRIEFDIPRVADSSLYLKTAPETPPIQVAHCFGALRPNTSTSPELSARLGPVEKLAFSWTGEPDREEAVTVEVEQHFDLLARPTQMEIRATFAFRIDGGRIRHLNLVTDPRWRLSGQFRCNEYSVEKDEKTLYLAGPEGLPSSQNEVVRVTFQEPVSGLLTLHADFVLRDFGGIGRIRLPRFEALNTRVRKSTLAAAADPLLEIDCPKTGLVAGYRSGWQSAELKDVDAVAVPPAIEKTISTTDTGRIPKQEETPLAEYDLMRTEPSWNLGVRLRDLLPEMRLTQNIRFDYGDSSIQCRADFFSAGEQFQQRFTVPDFLHIDSVRVRDAQEKPVDIRWSRSEPSGHDYCVFFRQPVSGRYSLTIRGGFETKSGSIDSTEPAPVKGTLPIPVFENVRLGEQTFNVFRTAATMIDIQTEKAGWSASEVAPTLPERFQEAFVCGSWKKKPTADAPSSVGPDFSLFPNRPEIHGTQISTLSRHDADAWNLTFDFLWDVTGGELDTIRLRWDEQCSVLSIEPSMPFHLEQHNGRPSLVLTPGTPVSGKHHFRIRSALNMTSTSVSVPHVGPDSGKLPKCDIKSYVILPRLDGGEPVPWNLSMLEEVDEATIRQLDAVISQPLEGATGRASDVAPDADKLCFQTLAEDFSASISRQNAVSVVDMYDVSFVVKGDGVVFGIATIDLKSRGQDSFILRMPSGYELIQIVCSGIASKGRKLPSGDRWRIDLWSSDYPQRMRIVFRGTLTPLREKEKTNPPDETITLARLNGEPLRCSLALPVLEGVSVQKTVWLVTFDSIRGRPFVPLDVATVREKEFGTSSFSSSEILGERITELGRHIPATGSEAMQTLFKLNLLRLDNLRKIIDLISAPGSSRSGEVRRWFALWSEEWYGVNRLLDYLGRQHPESLLPGKHLFLLDLTGSDLEDSGFENAEIYLEAKNISLLLQALMVGYKDMTTKNFAFDDVEENLRRTNNLSMNSMLYWRDRLTEDAAYLFGASSGQVLEIRLVSAPSGHRWSGRVLEFLFPWVLLPLILPVFSRRFPFTELFCQFPHFWGTVAGVLLWSLFPPGYFGIAVLVLTFFSYLRPAWPKHVDFQEHPPG